MFLIVEINGSFLMNATNFSVRLLVIYNWKHNPGPIPGKSGGKLFYSKANFYHLMFVLV